MGIAEQPSCAKPCSHRISYKGIALGTDVPILSRCRPNGPEVRRSGPEALVRWTARGAPRTEPVAGVRPWAGGTRVLSGRVNARSIIDKYINRRYDSDMACVVLSAEAADQLETLANPIHGRILKLLVRLEQSPGYGNATNDHGGRQALRVLAARRVR